MPGIKYSVTPQLPARLTGVAPISVTKSGLSYSISLTGYPINRANQASPPTVNDDATDGFDYGSHWVMTSGVEYVCINPSSGAAVWVTVGPDSFADLTGNIAVSQMAGGTGASASTFWRGDGSWSNGNNLEVLTTNTDTPRSLSDRFSDELNVYDFIPFGLHAAIKAGTSTADVSTYLVDWITTSASEGKIAKGAPGRFNIDAQVTINLDSTITRAQVEAPRSFIIASSASVAIPLVRFQDLTGYNRYGLTWNGGTIDNSLGVWVDNEQTNSGLELTRLLDVSVSNVFFKGNNDIATETYTSDAGITTVDTLGITAYNNVFYKVQSGIYFSGTGGFTSKGEHIVVNNHFRSCQRAMQTKAEIRRTIFANNMVSDILGQGFLAIEVGGDYPARSVICTGNTFKKVGNPIQLRGPGPGSIVTNNLIEDFGFKPDGITLADTFQQAIRILGITDTIVSNNSMVMSEWTTSASHVGIATSYMTLTTGVPDPGPRACERTQIYGNTIVDVYTGIQENLVAPLGVNRIGFNSISGATVPYSVASPYIDMQDTGISIGKASSSSLSQVGIGLNKDWIVATRSAAASIIGSRTTNDGPVAQFYRDATFIGGIQIAADHIGLFSNVVNGHVLLTNNGTGTVQVKKTRTILSNDGNNTLTTAQFQGGIIEHSGMTVDRTDTTPTAAALVAAAMAAVGTSYEVVFANTDDASNMIIGAGAGVTIVGNATIPFGGVVRGTVVFTNIGGGTEAVTLYLM